MMAMETVLLSWRFSSPSLKDVLNDDGERVVVEYVMLVAIVQLHNWMNVWFPMVVVDASLAPPALLLDPAGAYLFGGRWVGEAILDAIVFYACCTRHTHTHLFGYQHCQSLTTLP